MPKFAMLLLILWGTVPGSISAQDHIREIQQAAVDANRAEFGHWGWDPENYKLWGTHSNRLIPVYTFGTLGAGPGIDLGSYSGLSSPYRHAEAIRKLYDTVPEGTLNPAAEYFDQTNVYDLQLAALKAGKKQIILVVFDGMDWQTTQAASIHLLQRVAYTEGRGTGLHFQDYRAQGTSQYGFFVTSPYAGDYNVDVDLQQVSPKADTVPGGYAFAAGGSFPWASAPDLEYPVGRSATPGLKHAYTDSASSATSMTAGIKTYNSAINVDAHGKQVATIAHLAQQHDYRIGVVTSVPVSHATPAAAYAHNVDRDDYQDLTRDLLGLPSISHPEQPLPGVDVLLGAGFGENRPEGKAQGKNFVPGNAYLTDEDLQKIDARHGGKYEVALRTSGAVGQAVLEEAAQAAIEHNRRLFGFFGVKGGHLPYRTANGDFQPPAGRSKAEVYSAEDVAENPDLADLTTAALQVLGRDGRPFWMMVEAGDVDWANHDNNIDNSIGAVISGDRAVKAITDWVEQHSSWQDAVVIVTADHGHYLVLEKPELLVAP